MSGTTRRPRILWVDDDPQERFRFEVGTIRSEVGDVTWAESVELAAEQLKTLTFAAVILDQNLTSPGPGVPADHLVWGACRLLYWLRSTSRDLPRPWLMEGQTEAWTTRQPVPSNRLAPAVLVSAFHDLQILKATRNASAHDRDLKLLPKPLDTDELLRTLKTLLQRRREATGRHEKSRPGEPAR
jgi:DNA-binding response OmpR family regulator